MGLNPIIKRQNSAHACLASLHSTLYYHTSILSGYDINNVERDIKH